MLCRMEGLFELRVLAAQLIDPALGQCQFLFQTHKFAERGSTFRFRSFEEGQQFIHVVRKIGLGRGRPQGGGFRTYSRSNGELHTNQARCIRRCPMMSPIMATTAKMPQNA